MMLVSVFGDWTPLLILALSLLFVRFFFPKTPTSSQRNVTSDILSDVPDYTLWCTKHPTPI